MNHFIHESKLRIFKSLCALLSINMLCSLSIGYAQSQDTIVLNLENIEEQFLKNNLSYIAAHYEVDIAKAAIIQAKAWPNPELEIEDIQVFKPKDTDEIPGLFQTQFWENRTFSLTIAQTFQLGGKRKYHINQQEYEQEKAQLALQMLLLELKKELRTTLAAWYFESMKLQDIQTQYTAIEQLYKQHKILLNKGQTSKVQVFRINSLLMNIAKEVKQQQLTLSALSFKIKEVLHLPLDTPIQLDLQTIEDFNHPTSSIPLNHLLARGKEQQKLFEWWQKELKVSELQIKREQAEAVPDLNIAANYDRGGNTHLNFFGLGVSMDLPFWNRNKGNRLIAKWEYEKQKNALDQFNLEWEKSVRIIHETLLAKQRLLQEIDLQHINEMDQMILGLQENLINRNLSLIEYLDYFEAFKESKEDYYDLRFSIFEAQENLNFLIGEVL